MAEIVVLCGIIVFLLLFIVFKEIISLKERDSLLKKIMAKNFIEYSNAELAHENISREKPDRNLQNF
jgi:hypothetical protein